MELSNKFIVTETDQSTHTCTAMVVDFLFHTQNLAIGQSITSQIFEMTCPKIGKSRWTLILFPAGQYEFESDNGQLSVYLKMIECEHEDEKLLVDVKFFIDSEEKVSKVVHGSVFHYKNSRQRWTGANLYSKLEFYAQANRGYLMRDNHLIIGCRMIHFDSIDDTATDIEIRPKQTLTLNDEWGNSLDIDVPSYSSPSSVNHSHVNGKELSVNDSTTRLPSISTCKSYHTTFPGIILLIEYSKEYSKNFQS